MIIIFERKIFLIRNLCSGVNVKQTNYDRKRWNLLKEILSKFPETDLSRIEAEGNAV